MAAGNANIVPIKGQAYRLYFPWFKTDGTLLTGATVTLSSISKDGGNLAATNGTATEIQTSGIYFLDLIAAEMQAECTTFKATASDANSMVIVIPIYTQSTTSKIPVDLQTAGATNVTTYSPADAGILAFARGAGAMIIGSVDTATLASNSATFETSLVGTPYATANSLIGRFITFVDGPCDRQTQQITAYSYATNTKGKITVAGFTADPTNGKLFVIT
jgi:hypothetical protein